VLKDWGGYLTLPDFLLADCGASIAACSAFWRAEGMAQNRPPPAFQEYAANLMARTDYRVLSLAQRGLLMTLRLECWVNVRLPNDPATLARVVGFGDEEIKAALPAIMPFFVSEGGQLICPELEDYRQHLQAISNKKSEGGKRGAATTNGRRKVVDTKPEQQVGGHSGIPRLTRGSLVQSNSVQLNKTQPLDRGGTTDPWLDDYEAASKGR